MDSKQPEDLVSDLPTKEHSIMSSEEVEELKTKVEELQTKNMKIKAEFDSQRAKLRDLYLQKENELSLKKTENEELDKKVKEMSGELDELKSQLFVANMELETNIESTRRKAAEEIASLQQIAQETVEQSSSTQEQLKKFQLIINHLENENQELKQHSPMHSHNIQDTLAPSLAQLSAVTKKIGRKLGSDFFVQSTSSEGEPDHHEDTELLKSLVGPLEEEIKALKDKLRSTDEELQKLKSNETEIECVMCRNYEVDLVNKQQRVAELESKVTAANKSVERHKEDLLKEIGFRKDMEEKWNEKREEHKKLVAELNAKVECNEKDLEKLHDCFDRFEDNTRKTVNSLSENRENVQEQLDRLQLENEHLIAKYTMYSQEYDNTEINLPNTVEELHEMVLSLQQEIVMEKVGKESYQKSCEDLKNENKILQQQFQQERFMAAELEQLRKEMMSERIRSKEILDKLELSRLEHRQLIEFKKTLETKNAELKGRISSLQQKLDDDEIVQRDFVSLSQNLQVKLEEIRNADTQVRWQHEEDVEDCPRCHKQFGAMPHNLKKDHCRHCGKIFCGPCLGHVVPSGRHQLPSKVCDFCHTLLVKTSAPYFSNEVPHSPD